MAENNSGQKNKNSVPPLSQQEREHLTYLRLLSEYHEAKEKRIRYKRVGSVFIIVSAFVFLALIFNLDSKIEFLCLWIITILYSVSVMIRADYRYDLYKEMLEINDDEDEKDEEEQKTKTPVIKTEPPPVSSNSPKTYDKNETTEKGDVKSSNE